MELGMKVIVWLAILYIYWEAICCGRNCFGKTNAFVLEPNKSLSLYTYRSLGFSECHIDFSQFWYNKGNKFENYLQKGNKCTGTTELHKAHCGMTIRFLHWYWEG